MKAAVACLLVTALVLPGCTTVPASERTLALLRPKLPRAGEMQTYAALGDVPGAIEVVGEIEVPNNGEGRAAIEARLRAKAAAIGANAIVLHPFNRWALGAGYSSGGWDRFDPTRFSRATALVVETRAD